MTMHPLEDLYMDYLSEKDISRGTYEFYKIILKQYTSYLKERNILYATTSDVLNYKKLLIQKGYKESFIHATLSTIKSFYKYLKLHKTRLELDKVYHIDMTENIVNKRRQSATFKPTLSKEDAKYLLITLESSRKYIWHYRDYALIYLMLTTALRSIEVRRAKFKDITSIGDTYILNIQGKGRSSKDSYVKLTPSVKSAIDVYLSLRKDYNPYLFISHSYHTHTLYLSRNAIKDILARALKISSLEHLKLSPHSLRHTAATLNLKSGAKLEDIRLQLRHSDISTTSIYIHEETKSDASDIENFIWDTSNE